MRLIELLNPQWSERLASLRRIPEIVRELWRASGVLVVVSLSLRLVLAGFPPLILWISKQLIDAVNQIQRFPAVTWSRVWQFLIIEFILVVSIDIAGRMADHADQKLSEVFSHRLSVRILAHSNRLDLEDMENPIFQDQLERARSQISIQLTVLRSIAQLIQNGIGLVTLIAAVAIYAPWLVALQVVALVPIAVTEMHYAAVLHRKHRERTPLRRTMEYLMNLSTNSVSVKEVKAFRLGEHFITEYDHLGERFKAENLRLSRDRNAIGGILTALGTAAYYGAYAYLVWQAGRGSISIGTLFFLGGSFQRSKWQLQEILSTMSLTLDQTLRLGDVFEFFAQLPESGKSADAFPCRKQSPKGSSSEWSLSVMRARRSLRCNRFLSALSLAKLWPLSGRMEPAKRL
jgi:ATP-binding cassette subfamily B protein